MHPHLVFVGLLAGLSLAASCKEKGEAEHKVEAKQLSAEASTEIEGRPNVEVSPHYPTASAAGTKELFFLEEPDRGEHITKVVIPAGGKTIMKSGFCEMDEHDVVCVAGTGRYRVRQVGSTRVVEELRKGKATNTHVIATNSKGERLQIALVDEYGDVVWVRSYKEGGAKYSSRSLAGGNTLDGCGSRALKLDKKGRATSATCLQWSGSPMLDASGVARASLSRAANGLVERIEFFGVDDAAVERHDGVHAMVYKRSPKGLILRTDYLGLDKKPALSTLSGCASEAFTHDSEGHELSTTCMDANGDVLGGGEGIAKTVSKRDARGCAVSHVFLDAAGQPQKSRRRGYEQRFVVNDRCEVLEGSCYDSGGNLANCESKVAKRTYEYDDSGRVSSLKHFDARGNASKAPGLSRFELRYKYDVRGNQIERACFDSSGKAAECSGTGAHAFLESYDDAGRKVETRYVNTAGEPTRSLGTSVSRSIYDNYDHTSQVLREDEQGNLISSNGMSKMTYLYDRGHQVFGVLLHDADDNPANYGACFVSLKCPDAHWHALRVMRSESGEVRANVFFDAQKREILTLDCSGEGCWGD